MSIQLPSFNGKSELFAYLVKNKTDLIELKKSAIKHADCFSLTEEEKVIVKDASTVSSDTDSELHKTIIGNTYLWMDNHDDVHLENCFAKSISERKNKVWHLHDHLHQITAKVGVIQRCYEKHIDWIRLGVNKVGQTQALFADTLVQKELNAQIFKGYRDGEIQQHSVGMVYVKIDLCINDPEFKAEYANWNKYIDLLGNRERAEDKGFFWIVKEAKLIEISCVLEGSNELTPTMSVGEKEMLQETGEITKQEHNENKGDGTPTEPDQSTQEEPQQKSFDVDAAIKQTKFLL